MNILVNVDALLLFDDVISKYGFVCIPFSDLVYSALAGYAFSASVTSFFVNSFMMLLLDLRFRFCSYSVPS